DELKTAISSGGLYVFSLTQQYDDLGQKITPSGVTYGHAYSIADCISVMHNGQEMQLIRIQNPWGGGSEWVSTVSEGSQFWVDHPELAQKEADAKSSGGNYWIEREQFETLTGRTTFDVTMPLPLSTHTHTKSPLVYAFDETTAIAPPYTAQLCALATRKNDLTTIQVTTPTNLIFLARWLDGSGARNHQIKFANMSNTFVVQTDVTNSAGLGTKSVTLQPGTYKMLPCTQNMMADRGTLEITIMSDRDFVLSRNGAIA
ncbi:MAG: C2 family cysteine protease, partial [Chroococcidiopsis sp.]